MAARNYIPLAPARRLRPARHAPLTPARPNRGSVRSGSPGGIRTRDLSLAGRAQGAFSKTVEVGSPGGIRTRDLSLAGRAQGAFFKTVEVCRPGGVRTRGPSPERGAASATRRPGRY